MGRLDEFHPAIGSGVLMHAYATVSSTFLLSFKHDVAQMKKNQWAVHLRSVSLAQDHLGGPSWPHRVAGKLNGRQCVAIDPPKHLHVRREQCYNLTPLLKPGPNQLEIKFTPEPKKAKNKTAQHDDNFCVGVVLTKPRSVATIISRVRSRSRETVESGKSRVHRLLSQLARKEQQVDDCTVTGNFGKYLKPVCPVSLCPIDDSAIGRHCNHIQVFDLQSYIAVNQRMRSLDKRWTCPICSLAIRPDDIVLDPFTQSILDKLKGSEDDVEAVVFAEDCSWTKIFYEKKQENKDGGDAGSAGALRSEAPNAASVQCLSDSDE